MTNQCDNIANNHHDFSYMGVKDDYGTIFFFHHPLSCGQFFTMNSLKNRNLNENPIRILVFPCGSEIGLEIHRSLCWCKHFILIGGSSSTSNHGKFLYKNYIDGLPFYYDDHFINGINENIKEHQIEFIYPANDDVQLMLMQNKKQLLCEVISPPFNTCEICRSKLKTYQYFKHILDVPQIFNANNIDAYPVFLKPDKGQGSEGIHIANSKGDAEFYLSKNPDLLILENLPGKEYTIDCFTDSQGVLRGAYPRLRSRIKRGISVETFPVDNPKFIRIANKINDNLQMRGAWFFQVKESEDGIFKLMEIAPRVAGSMGLIRNRGANLPMLSVYDRLGIEVNIQISQHNLVMDRALDNRFQTKLDFKHVYIDLDDTLIVEGGVNTTLVTFLFQCINESKPLHLITRNNDDITDILVKYRLTSLFDEVIQIVENQTKAEKITHTNAIFIDDSFQERMHVSETLNIPTFDLYSINSLIDYRR